MWFSSIVIVSVVLKLLWPVVEKKNNVDKMAHSSRKASREVKYVFTAFLLERKEIKTHSCVIALTVSL